MANLKTYTISTSVTSGAVNSDKLHAELLASSDITNYTSLCTHGDTLTIRGDAFINESNVDALILAHSPVDVPSIIKASYITKEIDGCKYFDDWRVSLVIDYQTAILTEQDLYDIEDAYEPIFKRLLKGDWMSANNKLSNVTIGGAVTQARHDIIIAEIGQYITDNY